MKPMNLMLICIATALVGCGHQMNETGNATAPATTNSVVAQQPAEPTNSDAASSPAVTNPPAANNPASTNQ